MSVFTKPQPKRQHQLEYWSNWVRLLPIIFFLAYLTFSVIIFRFGPWPYPVRDGVELYLFLTLAHFALLGGYLSGAFKTPQGYTAKRWPVTRIIKLTVAINLILIFPTVAFRTGSLVPDIAGTLVNPGESYSRYGFNQFGENPIIEYVRIFFGPFITMLVPLTVFYWSKLKLYVRVCAVFCILALVATDIAMGTNQGLIDLILLLPWLFIGGHFSKTSPLSRNQKIVIVVLILIGIVFAFSFFGATQSTRIGSSASTGVLGSIGSYANYDNIMVRRLSPNMQVTVLGLTSYISHGYFGLYLSLQEPFVPMFGVGNSLFLSRQVSKAPSLSNVVNLSYPVRIWKYGWNPNTHWQTVYPWFASDVSFLGTILVVFLIGRLFAFAWLDTLLGKNPFAVVMCALFILMLFYFPAHNRSVQNGSNFVAFWTILFLWLRTRRQTSY